MADGCFLMEVNINGDVRVKSDANNVYDTKFFDVALERCDFDVIEAFREMPKEVFSGLTNVLVMVFFTYHSEKSTSYYHDECDEWIEVEYHLVVREDYKTFYKAQVKEELSDINGFEGLNNLPNDGQRNYYKQLVGHWEEFYDQDFQASDNHVDVFLIEERTILTEGDENHGI